MEKFIAHQKLPTVWREREILRNKGQFWTPDWVANAMVEYVSQESDLIFDPATGKGAFCESLYKLEKDEISFYGTDIDPNILSESIYKKPKCFVERKDFITDPPDRKFKSIVANPPYIRHHRLDEKTKKNLKSLCAKITGFTIDGRAGYHVYFLLQILDHLEKNGRLAVILPADVCEGTFALKLWKWISENYCIESVVSFTSEATPFPNVDTNALIFFIKNSEPTPTLLSVKSNKSYSSDLFDLVESKFKRRKFLTLEITSRSINEAIETGLSRPVQENPDVKYRLQNFATVMRGIATGANEFFFLTTEQKNELKIPGRFFKIAVGRTRDVNGDRITKKDLIKLEENNRPIYLLSITADEKLPDSLREYLKLGEESGLSTRPLISQRKPWYKMEQREIPPLLFAYLGRRNSRFIKNDAAVLPLTGFLCVYPKIRDEEFIQKLWQVLNHPKTLENFSLVGKSYGSGAIKIEPRNLDKLPIPEELIKRYGLEKFAEKEIQIKLF